MSLYYRSIGTISGSREDLSASEIWYCDWDEAVGFMALFLGGYQLGGWFAPASFPELPNLFCRSVEITPFGSTDDVAYVYAKLNIVYGVLKMEEQDSDPNEVADVSFTGDCEALSLSGNKTYTWASSENPDDGEQVPDDVIITKLIPTAQCTVKYKWKETSPVDQFGELQGSVNEAVFSVQGVSFPIGTVMFDSWDSQVAVATDGTLGWSRDLKFLIKSSGWNSLWDAKNEMYSEVSPPLYASADLDVLFDD